MENAPEPAEADPGTPASPGSPPMGSPDPESSSPVDLVTEADAPELAAVPAADAAPAESPWLGPSLEIDRADPAAEHDPADTVIKIGGTPQTPAPIPPSPHADPLPTDRMRGWVVTAVLTLIGGILRFWQLGFRTDGGTPLFDEKYYAVQAAEMIRTGGVDDNQAYGVIVHPPLGKQIIALGEMLFGYNPIGWRFASAVAGTILIALVIRATRRLTRSTLLGAIAGILIICDGVSQVMAHTALLDTIQTPFIVSAFACLLIDRDQVRSRLARALADGATFTGGVPLGARWWRFAAGVSLGCATAVKWNGAYWIIGFGIVSVLWDISARRRYGVRYPVAAVARRDLAPSLWSLGLVPVLTYIASYWAWFANETGWDRHVSGDGVTGALKSLVTMTLAMLDTTAGILTPDDPAKVHPWESKPWAWPLSARPVLYYLSGGEGTTGCGAGVTDCAKRILLVGTPALWWVSLFVLAWALWKVFARLDWRYAAVVVGYSAGYLPWFTIFDRQMYFFYMTPVAPFLVIGITLVAGDILTKGAIRSAELRAARRRSLYDAPRGDSSPTEFLAALRIPWWRDPWILRVALISGYVGLVVANFIWLWPILMGDPITPERLRLETWLPSWG